jgi:hypothetical protein
VALARAARARVSRLWRAVFGVGGGGFGSLQEQLGESCDSVDRPAD